MAMVVLHNSICCYWTRGSVACCKLAECEGRPMGATQDAEEINNKHVAETLLRKHLSCCAIITIV